jgi:hypothetical protein
MHFEKMGFKVEVPGKEPKRGVKRGREYLAPEKITKADMVKWIKRAGIDEYTKEKLIKELNDYPANTMHHFYKNIHRHIRRIHLERQEEEKAKE